MATNAERYRAFLLRVWIPAGGSNVHATVKDVQTSETNAFSSLSAFIEWLEHEMSRTSQTERTAVERPR